MEQNKFKSKNFLSPSLTDGISRSLTKVLTTHKHRKATLQKKASIALQKENSFIT